MDPRSVAEGAGEALRQRVPPPERPFRDDIVDGALRAHVEGPCELGVYDAAEDRSAPGRLDGQPQAIAFDRGWWAWFRQLTPEFRAVLLWFAAAFHDERRRTALLEMADERVERQAIGKALRRMKHMVVVVFLSAAAVAHWGADQVAWLVEKMPTLKAFWTLVTGAR